MKNILIFIIFLNLYGCGIGGYWMNGNPAFLDIPYIPPRDYWVKAEPVNQLQRSRDWIECGGDQRGGGDDRWIKFPNNDKASIDARKHYFKEIQRCMLRKSYRYAGECNEFYKNYPACGSL